MTKVISVKQVGKNKFKRVVKFAFTRDELAIAIIGTVTIAFIIIRSLL